QDDAARDNLSSLGAPPPYFFYFLSNQIQDPGSCTKQPFQNQAADRPGDFCDISANHADWFLLDTNNARIFTVIGSQKYYFMDLANACLDAFFIPRAAEGVQQMGWDGFFLDNVDESGGRLSKLSPPDFPAKYPTDSSYRAAVESYLQDL